MQNKQPNNVSKKIVGKSGQVVSTPVPKVHHLGEKTFSKGVKPICPPPLMKNKGKHQST